MNEREREQEAGQLSDSSVQLSWEGDINSEEKAKAGRRKKRNYDAWMINNFAHLVLETVSSPSKGPSSQCKGVIRAITSQPGGWSVGDL